MDRWTAGRGEGHIGVEKTEKQTLTVGSPQGEDEFGFENQKGQIS